MPEYRAPGVHAEELTFRPRTIHGVATAVAGLVGPALAGPLHGPPPEVGSFAEFERIYGGLDDPTVGGPSRLNHTALAARAFFDNGGQRLVVVRVAARGGGPPAAVDYAGTRSSKEGSTGLAALEEVPDVSIVLTPAAAAGESAEHRLVIDAVHRHCQRMRHRVGLVDPGETDSVADALNLAAAHDDARLALYYPWVITADPTGRRRGISLPPSGFLAGVYARNDHKRGVHKPPAGLTLTGARGFTRSITRHDQGRLNPAGVNCLRTLPRRGHVVWGARTLSSDPEWRYINVRRYLNHLERSVETAAGWAAFEPNAEPLWSSLRAAVGNFLHDEWRRGRLQGTTPRDAYFVRCDRSTMTAADIANGEVICEAGVAPLRPAEFTVLRVRLEAKGGQPG